MGSLTAATIGTVLALGVTTVAAAPTGAASAPGPTGRTGVSRTAVALDRLAADTRGSVRLSRGADGLARVVSVHGESRNPTVTRGLSPRAAARAQLARYGALVGVDRTGTRLVGGPVVRTVTGDRVVHFTQRRGGLPVVAGAVAVGLRRDRSLASIAASVSTASVPGASYPRSAARRQALAVAAREVDAGERSALRADRPERRLYDPAVLGVPRTSDPATHARGVWWVEVHGGPAYHRAVLVDDRTGAVVLAVDQVEQVDRVVCDDHNFMDLLDLPCTHDFARVEGGPASAVPDVNDAYDLAGVVSSYYRQIGRIDLTRLLGVDEGDHLSLSSTVRYCDPFLPAGYCPLPNAFWNGVGMFYGEGFAGADDVVGHEMTHGVIAHNADLFYWGQSGAINESLADVMGEIVDHRHAGPGDSPHSWSLGEDLPIGAIRSLKDPGRFGQPDAMTSARYAGGLDDNGGVHTNSGVGNRTFYLISQGGKQGGQTIHGIDRSGRLTQTATLALSVIQHLVSGSDYADLAAQLDQSCHALARHGTAGFTAADCRNVHRATLATGLRTTPRHAEQPADAPMTCPRGTGPVRVLFDSEKGTPAAKFDAGSTWGRAPQPEALFPVPANATSGRGSWYTPDPQDFTVSTLRMHPVALPADRPAYLWFEQWRILDFGTTVSGEQMNYDAGTVEVADATRGQGPRPAERLPWVNGPHDVITGLYGNAEAGRTGFSRDSHGYLASRLALTRYAGHAASPQFTLSTDDSVSREGWYLDDVRVYTCGGAPVPRSVPRISGSPTLGSTLSAHHGQWSGHGLTFRYHWYADGTAVAGADRASYHVATRDLGKRLSVRVTAIQPRHGRSSTFSAATAPVTEA